MIPPKDLDEFWADRRCVKCDRYLDRRGSLCSGCMSARQDDIDKAEQNRTQAPWEFLNNEFQRMFSPKK